jgi:tetratricopeptide (TPR) repeat protein
MWTKCVAISWALFGAIHLSVSFSIAPPHLNGVRSRCSSSRQRSPLFSSKDKKNLSAAAKERREEEKRRLERKTDVVIGKTSALPDAQDYSLDPTATEQEWMRQASSVEQEIFRHTEKGMTLLKMLQLEEAVQEFDQVFKLRSNAYLWQAGIAKFYLDDLEDAAEIFVKNVATYESKFGIPASEERIWRDACELKLASSLGKEEKKTVKDSGGVSKMIAQIPTRDENDTALPTETRCAQ